MRVYHESGPYDILDGKVLDPNVYGQAITQEEWRARRLIDQEQLVRQNGRYIASGDPDLDVASQNQIDLWVAESVPVVRDSLKQIFDVLPVEVRVRNAVWEMTINRRLDEEDYDGAVAYLEQEDVDPGDETVKTQFLDKLATIKSSKTVNQIVGSPEVTVSTSAGITTNVSIPFSNLPVRSANYTLQVDLDVVESDQSALLTKNFSATQVGGLIVLVDESPNVTAQTSYNDGWAAELSVVSFTGTSDSEATLVLQIESHNNGSGGGSGGGFQTVKLVANLVSDD